MKKILIIDDDKLLNSLLERKLVAVGYKVIIAENGDKGMKKIKEVKPDLVLLDITMPEMNGYEVMENMAKDNSTKNIPIIVISNSGHPIEIERIKKTKMVKDWIIKIEIDLNEVLKKIKEYV